MLKSAVESVLGKMSFEALIGNDLNKYHWTWKKMFFLQKPFFFILILTKKTNWFFVSEIKWTHIGQFAKLTIKSCNSSFYLQFCSTAVSTWARRDKDEHSAGYVFSFGFFSAEKSTYSIQHGCIFSPQVHNHSVQLSKRQICSFYSMKKMWEGAQTVFPPYERWNGMKISLPS